MHITHHTHTHAALVWCPRNSQIYKLLVGALAGGFLRQVTESRWVTSIGASRSRLLLSLTLPLLLRPAIVKSLCRSPHQWMRWRPKNDRSYKCALFIFTDKTASSKAASSCVGRTQVCSYVSFFRSSFFVGSRGELFVIQYIDVILTAALLRSKIHTHTPWGASCHYYLWVFESCDRTMAWEG